MTDNDILKDIKKDGILSVHFLEANTVEAHTLNFHPSSKGQKIYIINTNSGFEKVKSDNPAFTIEVGGTIINKIKRIFAK